MIVGVHGFEFRMLVAGIVLRGGPRNPDDSDAVCDRSGCHGKLRTRFFSAQL